MAEYGLVPGIGWVINMPEPLISSDRFLRIHKRVAKEAATGMMRSHQVKRLDRHFRRDARHKYNHYPRKPRYIEIKLRKFGSAIDLVKTGRLKKHVLQNRHQIQLGGDAVDGLRVRMFVTFPFPMKDMGDVPASALQGVTGPKMMEELERWTDEDVRDCAEDFNRLYQEQLLAAVEHAPRLKKRIGAKG